MLRTRVRPREPFKNAVRCRGGTGERMCKFARRLGGACEVART